MAELGTGRRVHPDAVGIVIYIGGNKTGAENREEQQDPDPLAPEPSHCTFSWELKLFTNGAKQNNRRRRFLPVALSAPAAEAGRLVLLRNECLEFAPQQANYVVRSNYTGEFSLIIYNGQSEQVVFIE